MLLQGHSPPQPLADITSILRPCFQGVNETAHITAKLESKVGHFTVPCCKLAADADSALSVHTVLLLLLLLLLISKTVTAACAFA